MVDGDIGLAPLNLSDVRAVDARPVTQFFLGNSLDFAVLAHQPGQPQTRIANGHGARLPSLTSRNYSLNLAFCHRTPYASGNMRAQRRAFWMPPGQVFSTCADREALTEVQMLSTVTRSLRDQLYSPARVRGGLLYGFHQGDTLHIVLASTAGSPSWYRQRRRELLDIDERFALGWSEALINVMGDGVDWVGNWIAYADSQTQSEKRDLRWFKRGQRSGLFDDSAVLLVVVGWNEGELDCRTYVQGVDGQPEQIQYVKSPEGWTPVFSSLFGGE